MIALTAAAALAGDVTTSEPGQVFDPGSLIAQQTAEQTTDSGQQRLEYRRAIQLAIVRRWSRHKLVNREASCDVALEQRTDGTLISVDVHNCTGNSGFRESVEAAVWRASPLPLPADPDLFESNIRFTLRAK